MRGNKAEFSDMTNGARVAWERLRARNSDDLSPPLPGSKQTNKILIVEFGSHYFCLEQLAFLLGRAGRLDFALRLGDRATDWRNFFFPERYRPGFVPLSLVVGAAIRRVPAGRIVARFVSEILFLGKVIASGFLGSKVFISTGPEQRGLLGVVEFWLIVSLFDNVVLNIRDAHRYLESIRGDGSQSLESWLLAKALRGVNHFSFENHTLLQAVKPHLSRNVNTFVVYARFSDYPAAQVSCKDRRGSDMLRIGLVGQVDSERRNYEQVLEALSKLAESERSKIGVTFLSGVRTDAQKRIVKRFRETVDVVSRPVVSDAELIVMGASTDLLLAPVRTEFGYGPLKSTGAIADSLFLRRTL